MGLLARAIAAPFVFAQSVSDEVAKHRRLRLTDGAAWQSLFGRESHAGKIVTLDTALQLSTVFACVKVNAQAVSSLPLAMYEKQRDDSRVRVDDDAVAEVIAESPNEDQTPLEFWEEQVAWLLTTGNSYAERTYSGRRLTSLQPIMSTQCKPVRQPDGTLVYRVGDRGKFETLPRDKIFHIKGFGQGLKNRDLGLSPLAYGAHSLGGAMAAEEAAGKMFGNSLQASGVLSSEQRLNKDQRKELQAVMESYVGSNNSGKLMILEAGLDYKQLQLSPEDAQMLETRRFSVEDLCRWYGTPPIIIGHAMDGQTMWGTGVEAILLAWLTLGIDPVCDRIEARIRKQLIRPTGSRRRYAEFNREALMQMDSAAKARFLSTMVQNGLMDRNEGRAKLNLANRDGAGRLTAQTNLAPLDQLGAASASNGVRAALRSWLGVDDEGQRDEQA